MKWESLLFRVGRFNEPVHLKLPLIYHSKSRVLSLLNQMDEEIAKLTWYCELPKETPKSKNLIQCGACPACTSFIQNSIIK